MQFKICSTRYEIPEFYHQFRKELPKLVIVADGYLSEMDDATFDVGQIIRFHACSKQRRFKAVAMEAAGSQEALYSIPLDHPHPLFICDKNKLGKEKVWKPQLLKDIVENHKLPLAVKFASPVVCEGTKAARISTVTLTEGFDEIFLLGNNIDDGGLNMEITAVPVKRTGMTVALLTGIQGRTDEEWSQYCTELNEAVTSSISFSYQYGPSGIRPYDLTTTNSTNSKRHSLRGISQNLSKILSEHDTMTTPKVDMERSHYHSPPDGDSSYCEINAGFQDDPQLPGLSARTESKEDKHIHYKCEGKTITTVIDVSNLLRRLKLENHIIVFKERGIDGHALFKLSEQILEKEYNFKKVESVKLMSFIRAGHIPK
ncbi:hypothetical protein CHS0354_017628 [Potamilus streckersoni]|uniref:CABIT domain-containing protein n=1 Tax=Potamilus streckersoni TaxID=2493646 RepID=A0AAE0RNZ1_9BIVA|nr:hypothetical protein CHS0354_017628 [Potamilus streckersoni]